MVPCLIQDAGMDVRHADGAAPNAVSTRVPRAPLWAWILAVPGLAMFALAAIGLTPLLGLFGCRLGGFFQVRCEAEWMIDVMEIVVGGALLSLVFWEYTAPFALFALGFLVWQGWRRLRRPSHEAVKADPALGGDQTDRGRTDQHRR